MILSNEYGKGEYRKSEDGELTSKNIDGNGDWSRVLRSAGVVA